LFYIYENWVAEGHKVRIHKGECSFCKEGKGIHPNAGARNGRWLGPFTQNEVIKQAELLNGWISECKHCRPTSDVG
jgi:hypothetical protein